MDMAGEITELLNTGGFVAMCGILMWYIKYITDQHRKEVDDLKEVITKGTIVLQRILDKIHMDEDLTKENKHED